MPSLQIIITRKELRLYVPYTPQHILRLEKAGKFPRRLQIGPNRVGWFKDDIVAWQAARLLLHRHADVENRAQS